MIDGPGDVEVRVGVEAIDETLALVAQVALDLELHVEGVGGAVGRIFFPASEFAVHAGVAQIGYVGHHTGDGEAHARTAALRVVAVVPLRILHDGLAAHLVEGDALGVLAGGRRHREQAAHKSGIFDAPLQHLHPAHRAAEHAVQTGEPEVIAKDFLRAHHVAHGRKRKRDAVRPARLGIERRRAAAALVTAEDIGA